MLRLLQNKTDKELKVGDSVTTFRDEPGVLKSMEEPHKPSSSGRVTVKLDSGKEGYWFPGVIGAHFEGKPE